MSEGAAAAVADERPLSAASSSLNGWAAEKTEPNWCRKTRSLESRAASGPSGAAQELLRGRRAGPLEHDAAVEEEYAGELEPEPALEVPRHQLGRDPGAHVVGER